MHIISASRRTDIPHYYPDWFAQRRKAGYAEYRTVYGGGKAGYFKASLKQEDVYGYLFWTKYAGPFHRELAVLRKDGVPYVFQYTITGYGKDVQPGIPDRDTAIADFKAVAAGLPGPECIQLRYDPILISDSVYTRDWHRKNFMEIVSRLAGFTRVVNVSFTEPYLKAIAKVPEGHKISWRQSTKQRETTYIKHPELHPVGAEDLELLCNMEVIARNYGMQFRVCCNSEYSDKFPKAQCCGAELFTPYGQVLSLQVAGLKAGPSRESCQCVKTIDIGMDNTCPGGCFYCYVTTSPDLAIKNFKKHDPNSAHQR